MKIAIITTGSLPVPAVRGGAVENLIDILISENEKYCKMEFDVYSMYDPQISIDKIKLSHTNYIYISTTGLFYKFFNKLLIQIEKIFNSGRLFGYLCAWKIRDKHYDAILIENFPFHIPSLKYTTKYPILFHLHNSYICLGKKRADKYLKQSDGIICISNYIAKEVNEVANKFKISTKISVAHNGIDITKFQTLYSEKQKSEIRSSLGIGKDKKIILFTGRFIPEKGVKELLQAFLKLKNKEQYILLIIGGNTFSSAYQTPYILEVKSIADKIKDNVIFTGYIEYAKIIDYYHIADVQCVPSIWEEPAGLVSLEGMAAGLPLVTSDSGGIPEHVTPDCGIIVKRGNGYVERLANALEKILTDDELRYKMGEAGKTRVKLFTKECYYNNVINAIKELL